MSYADHNLISGETITFRGQVHWSALITAVVPAMVIDILGVTAVILAFSGEHAYRTPLLIIALVLFVVSSVVAASGVLKRRAAEFVITNKRVIAKVGILEKQTSEIFLNKIESVAVDQNLRGRMLGYGTVIIKGTGGTVESFQRISAPFEFRRQIQERIGQMNEMAFSAK